MQGPSNVIVVKLDYYPTYICFLSQLIITVIMLVLTLNTRCHFGRGESAYLTGFP